MSAQHSKSRPSADAAELRAALEQVCSRDFGRLLGRWLKLKRQGTPDSRQLQKLRADIDVSIARRAARAASKPPITLDQSLPISARADDIIDLIDKHQVIVIAGETGSGKTTQLPKLCLAAGRGEAGLIGCTQPRRLAARSMARRVAEELGTTVGDKVGFQVRFTEQVGDNSLIKFMTDGIALAETQSDPWLSTYDTLIIDEAHERSLNIDFLLGYLKRLAVKRPDLKIIVTSATIDTRRFSEHFDGAPVLEVEGRAFPVELRWRPVHPVASASDALVGAGIAATNAAEVAAIPAPTDKQKPARRMAANIQQGSTEHIAQTLDEITAEDPRGDVLVFLPGEREIRDAHLALSRRQYRHTEVLPLYARLSAKDQDRVFKPGPQRRVVLATNVAETSLTVPRIRYVIDTGTARVKRYSQRTQIERLHVEPISQAAADQRKGRCGRVGPGICVRLYDAADYTSRPRFTDPELLRSSLANVILRMLALKLGEVDDFPFLEAPEPRAIADGYRRLAELSAIDDDKRLSAIGRTLARLPIDVQLARMLVEAERLDVLPDVLAVVAFLSTQDPRERPADARQQADAAHKLFADPKSDFVSVLNLWHAYRQAHEDLTQSKLRGWCQKHYLSFMRMREWREVHRQLLVVTRDIWPGRGTRDPGPARASHRDIASAHPESSAGADARGGKRASKHSSARVQPASQSTASAKSGPGSRVPGPEHYESIHRSLLAGLPTQVGNKDEKGIYRGTRERKFQVFPGSALAKSPPNWIFSAQILDVGSRVWAMHCARVEPKWIEQQAAHLLRASCSGEHWSRQRGAVVAWEQVTLFGLVLVARRAVTFHKQDPARAHAVFLQEALARCDIDAAADHGRSSGAGAGRAGAAADHGRSSGAGAGRAGAAADFIRANARVLEQAQEMEAQQRRQGLLKSDDELAAFFVGKLPEDIASSRALDAWYRQAAPAEQASLRWSLADVLATPGGLDAKAFPAALELDGQRYRLEYRFVPGDPADGVSLRLPLALLNALPAARCQWLVPGLLAEKVAELIRGLPKSLRRNFVPAPDFARAFAEAEAPRDVPLAEALAKFLLRTTGVIVQADAFADIDLPAHLSMRFVLQDEHGKTLASGRDLTDLRAQWRGQARAAFARKADTDITRDRVEGWDFDAIPARISSAATPDAFPALVDLGETVALRLFERNDAARAAHVGGVERLLRNALQAEFKRARRQLPIRQKWALKYAPVGSVEGLRDDLVEGGFADLLAASDLHVRTRDAFDALHADLARQLFAAAVERLKLAEPIIAAQAELKPWLQPPQPGFAKASYADLAEQFDALLAPGSLRELPAARLTHIPRYLAAMRQRAERMRDDPGKEHQRLLQVQSYWRQYLDLRASAADDAMLETLRWLIEEWRVSVFAQELKTAEPVSPKRLRQALEAAQESVKR